MKAYVASLLSLFTAFGCPVILAAGAAPASFASLESLVAAYSKDPTAKRETIRISPEWVGTVKRTFISGNAAANDGDQTDDIRFTHAWISNGRLRLARVTPDGTMYGTETPVFRRQLEKRDIVVGSKSAEELEGRFGPQHGWTDAWGDENGNEIHTTRFWAFFTVEQPDRIRYMSIFASVVKLGENPSTKIDRMEVDEGIFRPADPGSLGERARFKTGEEIYEESQKALEKGRAKYPLPLRELLAAAQAPGDHDLAKYAAYLSGVRRNPDCRLIQQIMDNFDEDGVKFGGFLENILSDYSASWIKVGKWAPDKRREATGYLIDSLDRAKDGAALRGALVVILDSLGGGEIVYHDPNSKIGTTLRVFGPNEPAREMGSGGLVDGGIVAVPVDGTRRANPEGGTKLSPSWSEDGAENPPELKEVQNELRSLMERWQANPQ